MKNIELVIENQELTVFYDVIYRDVVEADTPFGPIIRQDIESIDIIDVLGGTGIDYTVIEEAILEGLLYVWYIS